MKDAQCEYALYLLQHLPDEDLRLGIQTQGVVAAGVVKERYGATPTDLPFPPTILSLLEGFTTSKPYRVFDLERDEEQETDYDAVGNLPRDV